MENGDGRRPEEGVGGTLPGGSEASDEGPAGPPEESGGAEAFRALQAEADAAAASPSPADDRIRTPEQFTARLRETTPRLLVMPVLVVINAAVFVWMAASGVSPFAPSAPELVVWGGNLRDLTYGGEWWRLFSSAFVHVGLLHIALNMIVLVDVGRVVERLYGNAGFLVLYLAACAGGGVASAAAHANTVSAGASGGVFGAFGALVAYLALHHRRFDKALFQRLAVSAGIFFVVNLGLGRAGVDVAGHVGGFMGGLLAGFALALPLEAPGARRTRRAALAALPAAGLVAVAALAMPSPGKSIARAMETFGPAENRAMAVVDRVRPSLFKGDRPAAELAREVEAEAVPAMEEACKALDGMATGSSREAAIGKHLDDYCLRRVADLRRFAAALRSGSPETTWESLSALEMGQLPILDLTVTDDATHAARRALDAPATAARTVLNRTLGYLAEAERLPKTDAETLTLLETDLLPKLTAVKNDLAGRRPVASGAGGGSTDWSTAWRRPRRSCSSCST